MSFSTSSPGGSGSCSFVLNADTLNVSSPAVTTATIVNSTLTNANQEYSFTLPANTQRFTLRLRTPGVLKLSYVVGTSGTNYMTIPPGASLSEDGLATTGSYVLYVQSPQSGAVVELVSWA
jgi:hypothetical protein